MHKPCRYPVLLLVPYFVHVFNTRLIKVVVQGNGKYHGGFWI
jgi:hypothetical protein